MNLSVIKLFVTQQTNSAEHTQLVRARAHKQGMVENSWSSKVWLQVENKFECDVVAAHIGLEYKIVQFRETSMAKNDPGGE